MPLRLLNSISYEQEKDNKMLAQENCALHDLTALSEIPYVPTVKRESNIKCYNSTPAFFFLYVRLYNDLRYPENRATKIQTIS
jgi:hypothetical protein